MIRFLHILGAAAVMMLAQPGQAAADNNAAAAKAETAAAKPRAEKAIRIPEPGTPALFLLGAAGLIIGRRLSHTKRRRSPDA